jgi:transcription antitermination protein NusB
VARRKARELAFRTLFQAERGGEDVLEVWQQVQADVDPTPDAKDDDYGDRLDAASVAFAGRLLETFAEHRAALDAELEATLQGWSFGQMAQTDLNVLRLALTELRHEPGVPKEVTVEMAVRIAKKFGGEESGRFVNGVLARLLRQG